MSSKARKSGTRASETCCGEAGERTKRRRRKKLVAIQFCVSSFSVSARLSSVDATSERIHWNEEGKMFVKIVDNFACECSRLLMIDF